MNNEMTHPKEAGELRRRAEEIARDSRTFSPESLDTLSPGEAGRLLHELQVHQIELTIQNEELRRAQIDLEATRARYFDLYNLAPVGYMTLSRKGLIREANLTAATLLGLTRNKLVNQPMSRFISREDQDNYFYFQKRLSETGEKQDCELRMLGANGTSFWVHLKSTPARDDDGTPVFHIILNDITERKRIETALLKSQALLDQTGKLARIGGWEFDPETLESVWTAEVYRIHEVDMTYRPTVADGINFYAPTSRPVIKQAVERAIEYGEPFDVELEFVTAKGNHRWVRAIGKADRQHGKTQKVYGVFQDITDYKQAEAKIALNTMLTKALLDLHLLASEPEARILDFLLETSMEVSHSQYSFLGLLNESESVMMIHRWSSEAMAECVMDGKPMEYLISTAGIWADCVRKRVPVIINNYDAPLPGKKGLPHGHVPIGRFLAVPILDGPRIVAVAVVANKATDYGYSDAEALTTLFNKSWDILRRQRSDAALKERIKELNCLYGIGALLELPDFSMEEIFKRTVNLLPPAWKFPDITEACIVWGEKTFQTAHFRETPWMLTSEISVFGKPAGNVSVCQLEKRQTGNEKPFMIEEQQLLSAIAQRLAHFLERKQAEQVLYESTVRFRQAINATKDGLWEWDMNTNREFFSPRFCEIIGCSADDPAFAHTFGEWKSRIHPDDLQRVMRALQNHLDLGESYDVDYRHRHQSGEYRWQNSIGQAQFDENGKPYRMVGCIRDITERKRAEETLRVLSSRLLTAQEEEQRRIAMELHDQTGQDLNVLKLQLASLQSRLRRDQGNIKSELNSILTLIDGIIEDVRRLSHGLSPSQLQVLGLCAGLRAMIRNFSEKTGIPVQYDVEALDHGFPPETQIVLYRIFQETLTNIYKHARAKSVHIDTRNEGDAISIEIRDDGRGFDINRYLMSDPLDERGMGLSALDLRARMISGDLKIISQPGKGTKISLLLPINGKGAVT